MNMTVLLNTIDKVKNFIDIVNTYEERCYILLNHYEIDAKSILSIFSLDITQPLDLHIESKNQDNMQKLADELHNFIIEPTKDRDGYEF